MITTVGEYLPTIGKAYPEVDEDGAVSGDKFDEAGLPMVVSCTACQMTFALTPDRPVDSETGEVYCGSDCAA